MSNYFHSSSEFYIITFSCTKNIVLNIYFLIFVLLYFLHFSPVYCLVKKETGTSNYGDRI